MKQYKIFFTRVVILLLVVFLADIVIGRLIGYLFNKQKTGKYFITSTALTNANQDIIIVGNSHASENFDSPSIQQKLNKSTFNLGVQGQSMLYYYAILKSVLSYHTPKLIILNVDCDEFRYNVYNYQRMTIFLPYYHRNMYVDSNIALIGGSERYMVRSSLYRYNSTLGYILFNSSAKSYNKSYKSLGYDPQDGSRCTGSNIAVNGNVVGKNDKFKIDTLKVDMFISIIKDIKARKIPLLVTTTPLFTGYAENEPYWLKLKAAIKQLNLDYWDYTNDIAFKGHCDLFYDDTHLNRHGADVFTDTLIQRMIHTSSLNNVLSAGKQNAAAAIVK